METVQEKNLIGSKLMTILGMGFKAHEPCENEDS
jgi:hypothetical protein